jgi:hypothetical protein
MTSALIERLRRRYVARDHYALVVDVRGGDRTVHATLVGRQQADATAAGAQATVEALWSGEVDQPGVWLAEQVIAPLRFLARLAEHGLVPVIEEHGTVTRARPVDTAPPASIATSSGA